VIEQPDVACSQRDGQWHNDRRRDFADDVERQAQRQRITGLRRAPPTGFATPGTISMH
jgi:hypothetical protein